ncbi:MAG TPA: methyltransferase, partial [Candidatus Lachnoclostridium stercoripullorum]|nr:methyltransferase [Candidatus Lachnoclostridium stercoripullorum]
EEVNGLVDRLHSQGKTLAIWGASHQGFTLAATTRLGGKVSYIIDSAPFKQGRFAPASHLPIVAPEHFFQEPADAILIVAPGYTEEIASIIRERFGKEVEILALKSNHMETLR